MKHLVLCLILAIAKVGYTQKTVTICGAEPNKGQILIAVYTDEKSFPVEGKELKGYIEKVNNKGCVVKTLSNLPNGTYAFAAVYDANSNNQMDKNMMGFPKEAYGFSNDARGTFGPPNFSDAKVSFTENTSISFQLKL